MGDDWQVGDLALCIYNGDRKTAYGWTGERPQLRVGACYTVASVCLDGVYNPEPCLVLAEAKSCAPYGGFAVWRFIKVTPTAADEFDRETIALLNGQPVIPDIIFTAATPLCGHRDAAGGLTPVGGTPQPHQISGDLAEAERAEAPGGSVFTHDHSNTPGDIQNHGA